MPHASWECEWASQQAIGLLHSPSYAGNSWPSVACHPWMCIPYQVDQGARVKPQPEMGTSRWLTRRPVAPPVRSRPSPPQGTPDQNRLVHNIVRTITHVMVDMPPTGFGGYFAPGALQLGLDALNNLFVDCVLPEGLPMGRRLVGIPSGQHPRDVLESRKEHLFSFFRSPGFEMQNFQLPGCLTT